MKATEKILNQNSNATSHQQVIGALALSLKEMQTPQGLIQKSWASTFGIRANAGAVIAEDGWDDYWNTFLKNLFQIKENIERLSFQALPDPCNPYCASRSICRYHEKA